MLTGKIKDLIPKMLELNQDKTYELKEQKKKRTLIQNNYYWELLGELSRVIKISPEELHKEMIYKSCPFEEYLVPIEANLRAIEYYKEIYKIERNGTLYKAIRVYTGSSRLDTIEMGILLDNLIEECNIQGISTLTPNEINKMRALELEAERR